MTKSTSSNINYITRIIKEIHVLRDGMKTFNTDSAASLKKSDFAQRICTQCITTIEANKRLLSDGVLSRIPLFNAINLKRTRDISSHDYGSVDMNIVYRICTKLTEKGVLFELRSELKHLINVEDEEKAKVESGDGDAGDK